MRYGLYIKITFYIPLYNVVNMVLIIIKNNNREIQYGNIMLLSINMSFEL